MSKRDQTTFLDFEVEARDVFEEVKVGLKDLKVVSFLDDRRDVVGKGAIGGVWQRFFEESQKGVDHNDEDGARERVSLDDA